MQFTFNRKWKATRGMRWPLHFWQMGRNWSGAVLNITVHAGYFPQGPEEPDALVQLRAGQHKNQTLALQLQSFLTGWLQQVKTTVDRLNLT